MTRPITVLLAIPLLLGSAFAQTADPTAAAPARTEAVPVLASPSSGTLTQSEIDQKIQDAVQKEVAKVKEQLRDEVRAEIQGAQSASEFLGEQEGKKKLGFLEMNGYFRFRWDLFNDLNGGLPADPMGWYVWGGNTEISTNPPSGTQTSGNLRLRVDPTFNVSEQVRVKVEIDFLDNVVFGSTPTGRDYNLYSLTSTSQVSPVAGDNWFTGAIQVKRAWGEVQTPVGLLSFGRMPADWGAGIYYNAGGGIDQDFGDNVDRIQFSIPLGQFLGGLALTPYYEWAGSGITYASTFNTVGIGQPVNWTQDDDAGAIGFMAARTDTPDQLRRKLEKGATSLSYGLLFNYKAQRFGLPALSLQTPSPTGIAPAGAGTPVVLVNRDASAFTVDLFVRWVGKKFEIEAEGDRHLRGHRQRRLGSHRGRHPGHHPPGRRRAARQGQAGRRRALPRGRGGRHRQRRPGAGLRQLPRPLQPHAAPHRSAPLRPGGAPRLRGREPGRGGVPDPQQLPVQPGLPGRPHPLAPHPRHGHRRLVPEAHLQVGGARRAQRRRPGGLLAGHLRRVDALGGEQAPRPRARSGREVPVGRRVRVLPRLRLPQDALRLRHDDDERRRTATTTPSGVAQNIHAGLGIVF